MSTEIQHANDVLSDGQDAVASAEGALDGTGSERLLAYAKLHHYRRLLEDASKAVKAASEKLEPLILEDMALNGLKNVRVDLGDGESLTVMTIQQRFVNKKAAGEGATTEALCQTLKALGMGYMVEEGYSGARLKSKVIEMLDQGVEIPSELRRLINIVEVTKLTTRK